MWCTNTGTLVSCPTPKQMSWLGSWWNSSDDEAQKVKEGADKITASAQKGAEDANRSFQKTTDEAVERARPLFTVLQDRPLMARVIRSAALGGAASYIPALVLVPGRGARRGFAFFGAGLSVGWTLRNVCQQADRAVAENDF